MNITGACTVRLDQQHGNQPDNWRSGVIDYSCCCTIANFQSEIDVLADFFLQSVCCFIGCSVVLDQCIANFLGASAYQFQFALQEKTEAVNRVDVEWVADRDHQASLAESDWDHFETARVFA